MLSQPQIAERLRKVREQCCIKLEEIADSLGLPPEDVISLENGQRPVSTREIEKLAEIYWCDAVFFLSEYHELNEDDLPVFLHREFSRLDFTPKIKAALRQLLDLYVEIAFLRGILHKTDQRVPHDYSTPRERKFVEANKTVPVNEDTENKFVAKGESVAQKERRRLGLGDGPVGDVVELISKQGIGTAAVKLPKGLRGLFVKHPDVGLVILVNQQDSPAHRRFAYLHELAHALFDRPNRPVMMTYFFYMEEGSSHRRNLPEIRADAFAGEFLMPRESVENKLKQLGMGHPDLRDQINSRSASDAQYQSMPQEITYRNTAALAHHFDVDYKTVVQRLFDLKFINLMEKDNLNQKKKAGETYIKRLARLKSCENSGSSEIFEEELRTQLLHLACEAFHKEEISRGRFTGIGRKINIDYCEMFEILDDANFGD